jgi:hypothetical protein
VFVFERFHHLKMSFGSDFIPKRAPGAREHEGNTGCRPARRLRYRFPLIRMRSSADIEYIRIELEFYAVDNGCAPDNRNKPGVLAVRGRYSR